MGYPEVETNSGNQGYSGLTIDGNILNRVMGGEYVVFRDTGQYQIIKTKMKMVP